MPNVINNISPSFSIAGKRHICSFFDSKGVSPLLIPERLLNNFTSEYSYQRQNYRTTPIHIIVDSLVDRMRLNEISSLISQPTSGYSPEQMRDIINSLLINGTDIDSILSIFHGNHPTSQPLNTIGVEPVEFEPRIHAEVMESNHEQLNERLFGEVFSAEFQAPHRSGDDDMSNICHFERDRFPKPNFQDFSNSKELDDIIYDWQNNIEYRDSWIFSRREKEGFNRRNVEQTTINDIKHKIEKRKTEHELDGENSKFYDWILGGTNWILRLEIFTIDKKEFLISHYIHKPTNREVRYDIRHWDGKKLKALFSVWSETQNNEKYIEQWFSGTIDFRNNEESSDMERTEEADF